MSLPSDEEEVGTDVVLNEVAAVAVVGNNVVLTVVAAVAEVGKDVGLVVVTVSAVFVLVGEAVVFEIVSFAATK